MAKVTISVKGVTINYQKDGMWKFLFPFDVSHKVLLKLKDSDGGISLAHKGQKISILTTDVTEVSENQISNFIDLTADYSHKNGIKLFDGWENSAVLMTAENASFSEAELTQDKFVLIREDTGEITKPAAQISDYGKIEIDAKEVEIKAEGEVNFSIKLDRDCEIIFDNDCYSGLPADAADFKLFYQIIEDSRDTKERFTLGTEKGENLEKLSSEQSQSGIDNTAVKSNIIMSNISIGGVKYPCNGVTVSDTESLV